MAVEDEISQLHQKIADVEALARGMAAEVDRLRNEKEQHRVEPGGVSSEGTEMLLKWFKEDVNLKLEVINKKLHQVWPPRAEEASGTVEEDCSTASPTTLGSASEGSESENGTSWTLANGPLELWLTTRVTYNHAGDEKLYGFARKLTISSCGKYASVSAETRYEIDTPSECDE